MCIEGTKYLHVHVGENVSHAPWEAINVYATTLRKNVNVKDGSDVELPPSRGNFDIKIQRSRASGGRARAAGGGGP